MRYIPVASSLPLREGAHHDGKEHSSDQKEQAEAVPSPIQDENSILKEVSV